MYCHGVQNTTATFAVIFVRIRRQHFKNNITPLFLELPIKGLHASALYIKFNYEDED